MKYIKKLIRNSKRALNQQVIKKKQEIVKYAPRLTGIQVISMPCRQERRAPKFLPLPKQNSFSGNFDEVLRKKKERWTESACEQSFSARCP